MISFSSLMRQLHWLFLALAFAAVVASARADDSPLARLTTALTGNFTTAEQTAIDPTYRHVLLHAVPIWTDHADGPWLYLEQALADAPDLPFRQRVCQLVARADGVIEQRVFNLANPVAFTGAWRDAARLAKLTLVDLIFQEGCTVFLHEQSDSSFRGATEGSGCVNDIHGAATATAALTVTSRQIISWERGYNAAKAQVWGPLNGGYVFKRVN